MSAGLKVDEILQPGFFELLGRYVATCGHVERMVFSVILAAGKYDLEDPAVVSELLATRKSTPALVERLRSTAETMAEPLRSRALEVVRRIDAEPREARNLVIHGAWSMQPDGSGLRAEYFRNLGSRKEPEWRHFAAPVTAEDIVAGLQEVDSILRELIAIRDSM